MKMASSIVLSGNNFAKVRLLARHAGLAMVNRSTFQRIQNKYVCPTVQQHAQTMVQENVAKHAAKEDGGVLMGKYSN